MRVFSETIIDVLKKWGAPTSFVDVNGVVLFSQKKKKQYAVAELLTDTSVTVLPIHKQRLLIGYIIVHEPLLKREFNLLKASIDELHTQYDSDVEKKLHHTENVFWKNFLYGRITTDELPVYQSRFSIRKTGPYNVCFIKTLQPHTFTSAHTKKLRSVIEYHTHGKVQTIHIVTIRPGELCAVIALHKKSSRFLDHVQSVKKRFFLDIQKALETEAVVGIGNVEPFFSELPRAFTHLKDMVRTASKVQRKPRCIFFQHAPLYALLQRITQKEAREFIDAVFLDVDTKEDGDLLDSLQALYEANGNISAAAKNLGIHRNTLEYRLKKIQEETDLDPLQYFDGVQFFIALLLREVYF